MSRTFPTSAMTRSTARSASSLRPARGSWWWPTRCGRSTAVGSGPTCCGPRGSNTTFDAGLVNEGQTPAGGVLHEGRPEGVRLPHGPSGRVVHVVVDRTHTRLSRIAIDGQRCDRQAGLKLPHLLKELPPEIPLRWRQARIHPAYLAQVARLERSRVGRDPRLDLDPRARRRMCHERPRWRLGRARPRRVAGDARPR